jgi:hypothetical protein
MLMMIIADGMQRGEADGARTCDEDEATQQSAKPRASK